MIEFRRGDIFASEAEGLVDPVNCVGTHGAGLALAFKKRFPGAIRAFNKACRIGDVEPGVVLNEHIGGGRFILFLPTKDHWRDPSELDYIERGLADLVDVVEDLQLCSVAIPALGCGCGGLAWNDVKPLIEAAAAKMGWAKIFVYEPMP